MPAAAGNRRQESRHKGYFVEESRRMDEISDMRSSAPRKSSRVLQLGVKLQDPNPRNSFVILREWNEFEDPALSKTNFSIKAPARIDTLDASVEATGKNGVYWRCTVIPSRLNFDLLRSERADSTGTGLGRRTSGNRYFIAVEALVKSRAHGETFPLKGMSWTLGGQSPIENKLRDLTIMQFNVVFIATALLASASLAMSAQITGFAGADCTGSVVFSSGASSNECLTLGGASVKSISYSGVPSQIQFYISGGGHDSCTNGAQLTLGGGSGCATAPTGVNWESVAVF
ncbi:hypothetical protein C8J57DRAFT_1240716 [Mycena rebaudengoi]|nr:hypothetical protein C8J57DRAFT_1240716 [Mycena rebaudengoi]